MKTLWNIDQYKQTKMPISIKFRGTNCMLLKSTFEKDKSCQASDKTNNKRKTKTKTNQKNKQKQKQTRSVNRSEHSRMLHLYFEKFDL